MDFIWSIILQTDKILTPVFGILGLTFSILLLVSPKTVLSLGKVFNRRMDIDDKITYIDRSLRIGDLSYTNNLGIGMCLVAGSAVSLFFLFFAFEPSQYAAVFFSFGEHPYAVDLVFPTVTWCLKTACMVGIVMGLLLVLKPEMLRNFEGKMNSWFETQSTVRKMDMSNIETDALFFRHPVAFGIAGLSLSALILLLSIVSLAG